MPAPLRLTRMSWAGLILIGASTVSGQDYPAKPIRIATTGIGGGSDIAARLIASAIAVPLGQQVIVDNRAGILAVEAAAKAPPDGYTLLLYGNVVWIEPLMRDNVPWDPIRDFAPITLAANSPNAIVVHPSLPVKSVRDLIALAKARPGALNYASGPAASSPHLAAELFKSMAGVTIVRITYKGAGPAIIDLIGGQTHMMFATTGSAVPQVKSGKLRALAVTSAEPSALTPGLPTVAASGLPGYESNANYAVFAVARTPAPIINRLQQEIVRALNRAEAKEKLLNAGMEVVASSPERLALTMKSEMTRMGKVIKDAGIRAD